MNRSALVRQSPPELVTVQAGGSVAARNQTRLWIVGTLLLAALAAGIAGAGLADIDVAGGLWYGADRLSDGAANIRWGLLPVITALTVLHYLTSSLGVQATAYGADEATRNCAGQRPGVWEIMGTQFAGAAANRLAPAGLGTAAITCRYLTRRGLHVGAATTTVAVVGLMRGLTKLALVALTIMLWSGLGPALRPITDGVRGAAHHEDMIVPAAIGAAVVVLILVVALLHWRRRQGPAKIGAALIDVARSFRHLLRRPRFLLALIAAATAADLLLALAFAVSVMAVPGVPTTSVVSLIALYLLGATAGAAVPMPAGVGSTEAALIAALATVHIPATQAATGVLLFRVVTYWAPVPTGVLSTRWLRRRGGL